MDYMEIAKMEGYELVFTGLGMGYVKYGTVKLTDTMDKALAEQAMEKIGLAIASDWTRQYIENRKSEG